MILEQNEFVIHDAFFILGSYEEDLLPAASQEIIGSNRRNSFEEKQGTPIKIRKINPSARKPASKKPQQIRRVRKYFSYSC